MSEDENISEEKFKEQIANSKEEAHDTTSQEQPVELTQLQTRNAELQTEKMEVHHHPNVEKKNFKEYLLEGLMIFLAVTLGFFAENIREHITDEEKTKVFAASLYQDFKTDSISLTQLKIYTDEKIRNIDSLNFFIHQFKNRTNDSNLYRCVIYLISTAPFDNITGAYEQIKNTGSLRLFNQELINNLNSYEATALKLKQMEDWENKVLYEQVFPKAGEMFNFNVFDDLRNKGAIINEMYFRNKNEESVGVFLNQSIVIKHLRERQLLVQKILLQKTTQILSYLNKEYHLK
jgi:hypothetical protein